MNFQEVSDLSFSILDLVDAFDDSVVKFNCDVSRPSYQEDNSGACFVENIIYRKFTSRRIDGRSAECTCTESTAIFGA